LPLSNFPRHDLPAIWIDLSDDETTALLRELDRIVESDRYPFSPRIRTLPAIRAKLSPEPAREPLPRPKHDEPPRSSSRRWR
jgi:hypothetical protein